MSDPRIITAAEARSLREKATPGPWAVGDVAHDPWKESLPDGAVLIDPQGNPWHLIDTEWYTTGEFSPVRPRPIYGPYVVAWLPEKGGTLDEVLAGIARDSGAPLDREPDPETRPGGLFQVIPSTFKNPADEPADEPTTHHAVAGIEWGVRVTSGGKEDVMWGYPTEAGASASARVWRAFGSQAEVCRRLTTTFNDNVLRDWKHDPRPPHSAHHSAGVDWGVMAYSEYVEWGLWGLRTSLDARLFAQAFREFGVAAKVMRRPYLDSNLDDRSPAWHVGREQG